VLLALASPAHAATVTFEGTVGSGCTITLDTDGALAITADRQALTSELLSGGVPATVTVVATANTQLHVSAPVLTASGAGYNVGTQTLQVAYTGLFGLTLIDRAFGTAGGDHGILALIPSILTINNRILNTSGFPAGTYRTQTTVTCGP
jgi:hypothetical protein